ncbi:RNA polymerase sigma factor [Flintibacter sp. P01028]|uniref:RNA polymerase sigma factor n=1 Tax=Flintibacter sp. P01028 TaxID=3342382 RepID=UPI0035B5EFDB
MLMLLMAQTTEGTGKEDREALDRLLIEIAAGSREALAELYHRTRTAVYGITLSYVKNAHDAQDLTQDAFVRIWEKAPQYRPQGSPMAWILAVARNLALMALRQRERQADLSEEEWDAIPAEGPALSPEERELLQTALAALEEQERRIVVLHAVTGLKHREIAQLLELPLATVLSKYHRALKKLKVRLEGDDTR